MGIADGGLADDFAAVAAPRADHALGEEARTGVGRRHLGEAIPLAVGRVDHGRDGRVRRAGEAHLRPLREAEAEVNLDAELDGLREDPFHEHGIRTRARLVGDALLDGAVLQHVFRAAGDVAVHKHLAFEKRQADELAVVLDFLRLGHADGGVRRGRRRRHRVAAIRRGASDDEERGQGRAKCPKRCAHVIFHRPMIIHKERWPRNSEYACI